jgi:hypothetical protein
MDRLELEPLEPQTGVRIAASGTERILIGLALVALLGGVMVGVANLLQVDFEAAASGSPQPSGASPTPRQTLEPRPRDQFVLEQEPGPTRYPSLQQPSPPEWIRALADLTIFTYPGSTSVRQGTLARGEAAQTVGDPGGPVPADGQGWIQLQWPYDGWVATLDDGVDLVVRYPIEIDTQPGWVDRVAAGDRGFLAAARLPYRSDQFPPPILLASADGSRWSQVGEAVTQAGSVLAMAWGPAGWLTITIDDTYGYLYGSAPVIHRSADGFAWETLGRLPAQFASTYPELVGSTFGYLLFQPESYGRAWFSEDGSAWREMADVPWGYGRCVAMTGVADGFLAWGDGLQDATGESAISVDGRTWEPVAGGPTVDAERWGCQPPMVEQIGSRLVALQPTAEEGATSVWVGAIDAGHLSWRRAPGADAVFAGAYLYRLAGDGVQAIAIGTDRQGRPAQWTGDGTSWVATGLPMDLDEVSAAAAGPTGRVLVGSAVGLRGSTPLFWHLGADGRYLPEASPVFPVVPDRPADCGAQPTDFIGLLARDRVSLLACFGSAPYTVRAWAATCDWCGDGGSPGQYDPEWLIEPDERLYLAPQESYTDYTFEAVFDPLPALGAPGDWVGGWVEVTVHLDDPIAPTCSYRPGDGAPWAAGRWLLVQCRTTWVVDAIRQVEGP